MKTYNVKFIIIINHFPPTAECKSLRQSAIFSGPSFIFYIIIVPKFITLIIIIGPPKNTFPIVAKPASLNISKITLHIKLLETQYRIDFTITTVENKGLQAIEMSQLPTRGIVWETLWIRHTSVWRNLLAVRNHWHFAACVVFLYGWSELRLLLRY